LIDDAQSQGHEHEEIALALSTSEHEALYRVASQMGLTPAETLRKALAAELRLHALRGEGAVIEFRMPDETRGEIAS